MDSITKIVCLPIGKEWQNSVRQEFAEITSVLNEDISLKVLEPAFDELTVLKRIEKNECSKSVLIVIAALHGGSARQMVLAVSKAEIPAVIWCHDEKHSLASSALAIESLQQLGHQTMLLHGDCKNELVDAFRAANAIKCLKDARIGKLGVTHFNLISTEVNPVTLYRKFGAWTVPLSFSQLKETANNINQKQIDAKVERLHKKYIVKVETDVLTTAVRINIALEKIVRQQNLDEVAVDCWNEFAPMFRVSPCLAFAWSSYVLGCEGDIVLATTSLAGRAIAGTCGYAGDFYSFNEDTGEAVLMHCGGDSSLHCGNNRMEITTQTPPGPVASKGRVVACNPILTEGPGVILILHGEHLDKLHLGKCAILGTDFPNQMEVHVRVDGDYRRFRQKLAGNHYVVFPGDLYEAWKLWAFFSDVTVEE